MKIVGRQLSRKLLFIFMTVVMLIHGVQPALAAERYSHDDTKYEDWTSFSDYELTSDGGAIASGGKQIEELNGDAFVVKLDAQGVVEWSFTFNGDGLPNIYDVLPIEGGDYLFAGTKDDRMFFGRINSQEQVVWVKYGFEDEGFHGVARTIMKHGTDYVIAGYVKTGGDEDAALVQFDGDDGTIAAELRLSVTGHQKIFDGVVNKDGEYVLVGSTQSGVNVKAYMLILNSSLVVQHEQTLIPEDDEDTPGLTYTLLAIHADADGYAVTGSRHITGSQDMVFLQTNLDGNQPTWSIYDEYSGAEVGYHIIPTQDGGYLISGGDNSGNMVLLKVDGQGEEQWQLERDGGGTMSTGAQLPDGSYVLAGGWSTGVVHRMWVGQPAGLSHDDNTNELIGLTEKMEYSTHEGNTYTPYDPDQEPTFPGNVEVWVRYSADKGILVGEIMTFTFTQNVTVDAVESLPNIEVLFKTPLEEVELKLPTKVDITLSDSEEKEVDVTWDGGTPVYDGDTAAAYTFSGTLSLPVGIENPGNKKASVQVVVGEPGIESVETLTTITTPYGTARDGLALPATVEVTITGGTTTEVDVAWDGGTPTYDGTEAGTYTFKGTLTPPTGMSNPSGLAATVQVVVSEEPVILTGIETDVDAYRLKVGEARDTVVTAVYSDGARYTIEEGLTFTLSDAAVAELQPGGRVIGRSTGTVTMDVYYLGYHDVVEIEVWDDEPAPTPIPIDPEPEDEPADDAKDNEEPSRVERIQRTVGTGGHSIKLGDVELVIPAGALGQATSISISLVDRLDTKWEPEQGFIASQVYELTKSLEGPFQVPITLTLPYDDTVIDLSSYALQVAWLDEETGEWIFLDHREVDAESKTVSGQVDHFTKFAVIASELHHKAALIQGYTDGSFRPEEQLSRGHMATLLARYMTEGKITDIEQAIVFVVKQGLMVGDLAGGFRPDDKITRAEMATVITRIRDLSESVSTISGFVDLEGHWAAPAIEAARQAGLVQGFTDGSFRPDVGLTRAQTVVMLNRLFERSVLAKEAASFHDVPSSYWAYHDIQAASSGYAYIIDAKGNERIIN